MPPLDMNRFEQLRASGDLPSPRGVALAIMRLTRQEDVSLAELARVISGDPAFVGRLVKAANGLVAHGRRPVVSVQEALLVLGLPAVRTMALGFSLLSNFRNGSCRGFDYNAFWSYSLALGLTMQVLAQRTRVGAPDELFSAGLLARVGELALATLYPRDYGGVLEEARRHPEQPLVEFEQAAFALDHRELTGAMLRDWGLPRVFVEVIEAFGQVDAAEFGPGSRDWTLLHSLGVASAVAELLHAPETGREELPARLVAAGERLAIDREALLADCERVARMWVEWAALLQLRIAAPPSFSDLVANVPQRSELGTVPRAAEDWKVPVETGDAGAPPPATADEAPLRVLVVDADPQSRRLLAEVVGEDGHELYEASSGAEALERAVEVQPQLMVLGGAPSASDALELLRALRQTRIGKAIYILLLADQESDEGLLQAFEAGADDCLAGPSEPRVLAARLRAGCRVVRLQQELEHEREDLRHFAAELAVTNRRLQEAALTDALTGFPNRRYALDRIQQEWAAATRFQRPLSCMVVDLDNFKQVNDTHGHDVGDHVLRAAAVAMRGALRARDVICRTGGDEFVVICPETDLEAALACAARLCASTERIAVEAADAVLHVGVSIGVAVREPGMPNYETLMKRADQGVYLAKRRGRNRVATVQRAVAADRPGDVPEAV